MTSRDVANPTDPTKPTPPEGSQAPDFQGPVPTSHNRIPAEAMGDPEERRPDAGAQEGAAAGAVAGTAVAGPLGTVVGAVVGAVAGGADDAADDDDRQPEDEIRSDETQEVAGHD